VLHPSLEVPPVRETTQTGDGTLPTGAATDITPDDALIERVQLLKAKRSCGKC